MGEEARQIPIRPLTGVTVFYLGGHIVYLSRSGTGDRVVYDDGSIEKDNSGFILFVLKRLDVILHRYGLAEIEQSQLTTLIRDFEAKYAKPEPPPLDEVDHRQLRTLIERIEAVVTEALSRRSFAELTPLEGILDYKKLLSEGVGGLLGEGFKETPLLVLGDIEEAIKCLSYGAPTASVMMGLRAVEGMVRELHYVITGKKSKKGWAQLIDEVEEDLKSKGEQPPLLLGYLDYMRDVRNKADHPDKVFTVREAEQIFMNAIYTVQEILKLKGTSE